MAVNPIKRYGLIILLSTIFFHLVFMDRGVYDLIQVKLKTSSARTAIGEIEKENTMLSIELERLQKDDEYLEDMVRKKYGFVREGERVYRIEP